MSRKKGGRGLQSAADVVREHSLSVYVTKSTEPIMARVSNHLLPNVLADSGTISKSTIQLQHIDQWRGKALHGQWPELMDELRADSFRWLQNAHLKSVIESLLVAAQDQALHTNWLGFHIMKNINSDLCRRCKMFPETIEHIVAGCPVIAQSIYLDRHNAVVSGVHWSPCAQYGFPQSEQW